MKLKKRIRFRWGFAALGYVVVSIGCAQILDVDKEFVLSGGTGGGDTSSSSSSGNTNASSSSSSGVGGNSSGMAGTGGVGGAGGSGGGANDSLCSECTDFMGNSGTSAYENECKALVDACAADTNCVAIAMCSLIDFSLDAQGGAYACDCAAGQPQTSIDLFFAVDNCVFCQTCKSLCGPKATEYCTATAACQ